MAAHISRVEVRNFRNFKHLILDPFPARAVIVGENAVGKSNLLQALRLVLDPSMPDTARILRAEDVWDGGPRLADGVTVEVVVELTDFDTDADAKAVLSKCVVSSDPYVARLTYRLSPRTDAATLLDDGTFAVVKTDAPLTANDYDFIVFGGGDEEYDARRVRREIGIRVLHALRDAETDLHNWRRNPLRDLLEKLPLDATNLADVSAAVSASVDKLRSDPNVTSLETNLSARLEKMTGPRLPLRPTLGFASTEPDELIRAIRLYVDENRTRQVGDASLGGANVVYLGLLFEALWQQRANDDFVATHLAVEEPEAHLHVGLQRRLFSYLLRGETTLLLTTHSPHIAAVAPLKSLVVLRARGGETVGKTTAALAVDGPTERDLERYMDVSRAEILFATGVVLVEGLAELYIVPALAKAAGLDLDSYGIVVASVHGTDFAPYVNLLGETGLDTPWVAVTDGDPVAVKPGSRQGGLRRSLVRHSPKDRAASARKETLALPEPSDENYEARRRPLVEEASTLGFFVGAATMEIDLVAYFATEMSSAFSELGPSEAALTDFEVGLANELSGSPNAETRATFLGRIEGVGKGRYAQRLADHIERRDLKSSFGEALAEREGGGNPQTGSMTYLVAALDCISQKVRGIGIAASRAGQG